MTTLNLGAIRLNWKQDWSSSTAYAVNDCVQYGGDSFVCIAANTNELPKTAGVLNSTKWTYMARGQTALTTKGDIIYHDGAGAVRLPIGQAGQVLTVDANGVPVWSGLSARPAQTIWAGSYGSTGLGGSRNGYGNANNGSSVSFIMADRRRIKTLGRSIYGCGLFGNTADVTPWFPQDAVLLTPLDSDEYFVGNRFACNVHVAWTNKGRVYSGGYNNLGQLGHGDTTNRAYLERISYFVTNSLFVKEVAVAGDTQNALTALYFLTDDGKMYASGANTDGSLGDGTTTNRSTPVRCGTISGISDFDVGTAASNSVYAWTAAGALYTWGNNANGQLGLGDTTARNAPVLASITGVKYVRAAASNYYTSAWTPSSYRAYVLKTDGTVWAAGENSLGQLGVGDTTQRTGWVQTAGGLVNVRDIYVGNGHAACVFAITNATGTNANLTYCWGGSNANATLWQADTANRNAPVLFGQTSGNAAGWDKFWVVAYQRQSCVIGKKTDGTFYFAGASTHGNGSHLASGSQSLTLMADLAKYSIVDIFVNQIDNTETGLTFYFVTTTGEVLAAGHDNYGLLGNSNANVQRNSVTAVKF